MAIIKPSLNKSSAFDNVYSKNMFAEKANVTTVAGVVNKTLLLVGITWLRGRD